MNDNQKREDADARNNALPAFESITSLTAPEGYLADSGLQDAVNVALLTGQPLLITGEPGTGKTQLAEWVAYKYSHNPDFPIPLLTFHTKSTSTAKDVFYQYDALRHFYDANHSQVQVMVDNYISYQALGLVILLSLSENDSQREAINKRLPSRFQNVYSVRSIVLIDEIDKAPRDMPNDILNEIENMTFTVSETGRIFTAKQEFRPVLILTSNSEKDLPDAFLRRCIFYHIEFPTGSQLKKIVEKRLELKPGYTKEMRDAAIVHFEKIRELNLKKKPATAELLLWLRVLERDGINAGLQDAKTLQQLSSSYTLLAKYKDDRDLMDENLFNKRVSPTEIDENLNSEENREVKRLADE